MTPLQKVAMGIVLLIVKAKFGDGWDGLPDPLGWGLVLWGLSDAKRRLPYSQSLLTLAGLSLVASVLRYPPAADRSLDAPALWLIDLLPIGFEILLAFSIAQALGRPGRLFRLVAWLLVVSPLLAAWALSNESRGIADAGELTRGLGQLALVWLLFSVSRNPKLGGFPKVVRTAGRPERGQGDPPPAESL